MSKELDDLKVRADTLKKRQAARVKGKYQYARKLGFTPSEASVLMGRSMSYIKRLGKEKNKQ